MTLNSSTNEENLPKSPSSKTSFLFVSSMTGVGATRSTPMLSAKRSWQIAPGKSSMERTFGKDRGKVLNTSISPKTESIQANSAQLKSAVEASDQLNSELNVRSRFFSARLHCSSQARCRTIAVIKPNQQYAVLNLFEIRCSRKP